MPCHARKVRRGACHQGSYDLAHEIRHAHICVEVGERGQAGDLSAGH